MITKINTLMILVMTTLLAPLSYGQNQNAEQQEINRQVQEIMKAREQMLRSLLNDDSFSDMDKRMEEMLKRFGGGDFDFDSNSGMSGKVIGEYDWLDEEKYKILKLKVKQIKDRPLDIKIEKGMVKLKGDVEEVVVNKARSKSKTVSKIHFERSFSIPSGVDEKNPEFENKEGEFLIKFKKLKPSPPKKGVVLPKMVPEKDNDRIPVVPDKNDVSI
jgi:HSP20 family molecular chaperone IbpA